MHDYQQAGVERLYEADEGYAVLPMGAGKTIIGMTTVKELIEDKVVDRPLVVAPLRVAEITWPEEQLTWEHTRQMPFYPLAGNGVEWEDPLLARARQVFGMRDHAQNRLDSIKKREVSEIDRTKLNAMRAQKQQLIRELKIFNEEEQVLIRQLRKHEPESGLYVTNYENIDWLTAHYKPGQMPFDMVIFDELGRMKNQKGARFKLMRKHSRLMKIRHGLNGTPAPEGLMDLFGQVLMLDNGKTWGKNHDEWKRRYFMPLDYPGHNWGLQPGAQERIYQDLDHLVFKVPEEALTYQPGMQLIPVSVYLDMKTKAKYKQMAAKLAVALDEGFDDAFKAMTELEDPDVVLASNAAVASSKMRQIIQGFIYREDGSVQELHDAKFRALLELIEARAGKPVIVAYEFQADLKRFQRKWKGLSYLGHGVSSKRAKDIVRRWNEGKIPILAIHPASAGHGLNLQYGGSEIIWYNIPWSREFFDQTNARVDRQGQTRKCFGYMLMARGTIETDVVWPRLQQKGEEQADFVRAIRSVLM